MHLESNLHLLLPEAIVAGTGLGVVLAEVLLPPGRRARATGGLAAAGLALAALVLLLRPAQGLALAVRADVGEPFAGQLLSAWRSDAFALFARALAALGGLFVVLLSLSYTRRVDRGHGEFYGLLLFAILGVMLVAGVSDLLTLFICLELVTVSSYVLAAFKRTDLRATEAGLKYLVVGAVSSAVLLFGIALVYGAVGEVHFEALAAAVRSGTAPLLLLGGLVMVVVGIFFKVGAVPFQVWIPDVYQGAPSPVTAFLSTGSKAAGLVLLLRLAQAVLLPAAGTAQGAFWVWLLGVVAVVTLLFGILSAIPQRSFKRLLGYSSIGHAGYLLMGVAALAAAGTGSRVEGSTAILFYLLAFFFTNLTAFTVVVLVSAASGGHHEAADYRGLWKRSPFLAFALTVALLSLAGVPPLSGFFGKFLILSSVMEKGLMPLAVVGALGVAVSFYFYLLWIRELFVLPPEADRAVVPVQVGAGARALLWIGILAMLGMGIYMGPFYAWAEAAARSLAAL